MATIADTAFVEETEKRIRSHKGVAGFLVLNGDGIATRSTLSEEQTVQYAALVSRYVKKCRACTKTLSVNDELQMVRIRSATHEIMIAPDFSGGTEFIMVVIQDPTTQ
jgi:dynein light chain roadblock-type